MNRLIRRKTRERRRLEAATGVIGLAIMAENLILNMTDKGFTVACYKRTTSKVDDSKGGCGASENIIGCHTIKELAVALPG